MGLSSFVVCVFVVFFWEVILSVPVLDDMREQIMLLLPQNHVRTMQYLHGGCTIKPNDREMLADTLSHLRYPSQKSV